MGAIDEDYERLAAEGNFQDIDVLVMLESTEEQLQGSALFLLQHTVIHDEWRKRRARNMMAKSKNDLAKEDKS